MPLATERSSPLVHGNEADVDGDIGAMCQVIFNICYLCSSPFDIVGSLSPPHQSAAAWQNSVAGS